MTILFYGFHVSSPFFQDTLSSSLLSNLILFLLIYFISLTSSPFLPFFVFVLLLFTFLLAPFHLLIHFPTHWVCNFIISFSSSSFSWFSALILVLLSIISIFFVSSSFLFFPSSSSSLVIQSSCLAISHTARVSHAAAVKDKAKPPPLLDGGRGRSRARKRRGRKLKERKKNTKVMKKKWNKKEMK